MSDSALRRRPLATALAGGDALHFSIGGGGAATDSPASAVPTITGSIRIDGCTQPGTSANTLAVGSDAVIDVWLDGAGAAADGASAAVHYSYCNYAPGNLWVDAYASPTGYADGHGEGRVYPGAAMIDADAGGTISATLSGLPATTMGHFITPAATDAVQQGTSGFSACLAVAAAPSAPSPHRTGDPRGRPAGRTHAQGVPVMSMHRVALAAAWFAALISLPTFAATPLGAVRLVPDTAILLGANDQLATAGEVTRHVPAGNAAPVAIAGLPAAGVGIVGYHHAGGHYLAFDTSVVLGSVTFGTRDVAFTDGAGTWSKYFDGVAAGIPDGVAIDALALDPADAALLLSFDTTVVLDGITFDPRDVARYAAGAFTLHAALSAQIPAGLDLVGLDALPSGRLLVALDGAGSVGAVAFDDEDILEYAAPATWEMAYDGSAQDADWPAAGLAALAVETGAGLRIVPTVGLVTTESGGFASFTVSLLGAPTADVTVDLVSADTTEGTVAPASLTFTTANWGVAQGVTVTGVDDVLADGDVAYAVVATVASADPAYDGQFVVEVPVVNQDDEAPPPGSLQFSLASQSVGEGAGTLTVTVSRVGGSAGAVSVHYASSPGTAVAPGDFAAVDETLYWADGDSADKTFTVAIVDDAAVEGAETFSLALSAPDGGASLGVSTVQTVTLVDNDNPPPAGSLQFSLTSQSAGEGAGALTVTVSRVGGSAGAASVAYAVVSGTAQAPGDFTAVSGTLNWADGDATDKSFTVALMDDAAVEAEETFTATLSGATGATLGAPAGQVVTIADNDVAPAAIPALGSSGLVLLAGLLAGLAGRESRRRGRAMPRYPSN